MLLTAARQADLFVNRGAGDMRVEETGCFGSNARVGSATIGGTTRVVPAVRKHPGTVADPSVEGASNGER